MKDWWQKIKDAVTRKNKSNEPQLVTTVNTAYEINLVPEVKAEMIKSLKMRNMALFICIVVSAAAVGLVAILFSIKSGQDIAMATQDKKLETLSAKLLGYEELDDLVAIQGQLSALSNIAENKKILSRTFGALGVMLPEGEDSVQLSQLRVNLENNTLLMEGQADARKAPLIDYRVLESFKKGVALTKYDYGRYVDVDGNEIPTWCIAETDNGMALKEGESYYAWWDLTKDGCAATLKGSSKADTTTLHYGEDATTESEERPVQEVEGENTDESNADGGDEGNPEEGNPDENTETNGEENNGEPKMENVVTRVKIWRTPQYEKWYKSGKMELQGEIRGVEHFVSECTTYSGVAVGSTAKWTSNNDCMLAPDGLSVTTSSNARNESGNLVLKFTATTVVDPSFYLFRNKHMIAIGPMGQNVTDSYVQIQGMFTQEATECDENDADCLNNTTNTGGNSNE